MSDVRLPSAPVNYDCHTTEVSESINWASLAVVSGKVAAAAPHPVVKVILAGFSIGAAYMAGDGAVEMLSKPKCNAAVGFRNPK